MSTPTNLKHPPLASHNAPTPSQHLGAFSSPAPRSVPSPAAHRNQAGKSPFNTSTGPSNTTMAQNHPTASSASGSKTLVGSSPAGAAALNFDSPGALNLGLGALGGLDGGVGMGISMSGMSGLGLAMGLGSSMGGRPDDTEQRKRLENIIATLKARPGRVSKEGMERLAKQLGLSSEVLSDAAGEQVLLAHTSIMLDVTFRENLVDNVSVSFGALSEAVQKHEGSAARILKDDLTPAPGAANINLSLDKFAKNLERLARHDNLSIFKDGKPEVSCFEAIVGVYNSLQKLFEHEKKAAMHLLDVSKPHVHERASREVLCKKSGRPRMNANKTVGLSLEYWMERRIVFQKPGEAANDKDDMAMDVDESDDVYDESSNKIFSLTIECESSPAQLYPSIRVSDSWLSEVVEKPSDPNDVFGPPVIDWLDPLPTYAGSSNAAQNDPMALDSNSIGKLPNVRFVAKLNPPLVLPLNTAQNILASVNVQINQESLKWSTSLEALVLKPDEEVPVAAMGADFVKEHHSVRKVTTVDRDGHEQNKRHETTLYVPKAEVACVLDEIPFDHPRLLVQILPILRQYAHLTTLLQSAFVNPYAAADDPYLPTIPLSLCLTGLDPSGTTSPTITVTYPRAPPSTKPLDTLNNLLDGLLSPDPGSNGTMTDSPCVVLAASVLPNADVTIAAQDLVADLNPKHDMGVGDGEAEGGSDEERRKEQEEEGRRMRVLGKMGRALELSGDVGLWVEWVGSRIETLMEG